MSDICLTPIAHIETPYVDKFGTPRQGTLAPSSLGRIVFRPDLAVSEVVAGLDGFSHLWLISYFHQNANKQALTKVHPPRLGGARMGVLATRSPHHPNPLGLTLVELERIERHYLWVRGVDLISGTPILDIKPYIASVESYPGAREGWVAKNPWSTVVVRFTERFRQALSQITEIEAPPISVDQFVELIRESLQQDPRPRMAPERTEKSYWLRLYDFDIEFTCTPQAIEVLFIRFAFKSAKYSLFEFQEQNHQQHPNRTNPERLANTEAIGENTNS